MLKTTVQLIIVFAVALGTPRAASAAVITFDGIVTSFAGGELSPFSENFVQDGFYVESFWATSVGSAIGGFTDGHFHLSSGISGTSEFQHYNGNDQLQGFFIEQVGGGTFDLSSLDYNVRFNTSIDGFSANQVYVLLATSFDPTNTAASEFTPFAVSNSGTLAITGFEDVSRVFIASSASVTFDNVELEDMSAVPEPTSMLLLGSGVLAMAARRKRRKA